MCSSSKMYLSMDGPGSTYYRYDGRNAELYNKLKTFIYYEEYSKLVIIYNNGIRISIQNMGDSIFYYSYEDNDMDHAHYMINYKQNLNDVYTYILKYLDIKEYRKIILGKLKKIL